ncbi:unnamed protein product [Candidula unifasciata]|uniref:Zinc transporter ZIP10 n=1 Tax=Candidula unifasciata TaxID=100452 RepID=A0A8S3Z2V0_9EUPU|nr:unnamed protein product [Candidula unifasciata]
MCTQKRYAEEKERHSIHEGRHGGGCLSRKLDCASRTTTTRSRNARSKPESRYVESTSWRNVQVCNNSSSNFKGRCILSEQSIQCRHIICLLFACLAMTASAQHSTSGYDASSSPRPDAAKSQNWPVPDDRNAHIPLLAERHISAEKPATPGVTSQPTTDRLTSQVVDNQQKNSKFKESRPNAALKSIEVDGVKNSISKESPANAESKAAVNNKNNVDEESVYFILHVFHRYSKSDFLLMTDFELLLAKIGFIPALNSSEIVDRSHNHNNGHNDHTHDHDNHANHSHNHADHSHDHNSDHVDHSHNHEQQQTGHGEELAQNPRLDHSTHFTSLLNESVPCLSTKELLQLFQYENLDRLNADHFWHLCPALIDQLDAGYCRKEPPVTGSKDLRTDQSHPKHEHTHNDHHHNTDADLHDHDHAGTNKTGLQGHPEAQPVTAAVWFYALLSVAVISLCSVAGVVVIPNMKRVFYNHILQFLVALAVGAMSGDALLHLLPHAMLSDSHDHHHHLHHGENDTDHPHKPNHQEEASGRVSTHMVGVYKGLVALLGIYSFFFLERLFTLFTSSRSGKRERKHKRRRHCSGGQEQRSKAFHMVNSKLETEGKNAPSCEEMVMIVHPNKALRAYADVSHEAYLHRCDESLVHSPPAQNVVAAAPGRDQLALKEDCSTLEGFTNLGVAGWSGDQIPAAVSDAEIVGIIKDSEPVATTHSHSHSHLAPDFVGPLSSVAMMIIVGDVIHNFCDGLAVGAAYAGSVAGGLSTSVAVFCHELPHEIGDFAVLVRSGLTLRKAVYFNLVSSVPCFIGAIIGVAVGNVSSTSSWIFAGVGGMFLYVTLVDLIPEMSSVYTKSGEPWFLHLLLQASGIAVGTTVMLIMSVSEESLMTAFH